MTIANPLVSVLMTVRNGQGFVRHTIDSILGQSMDRFEFVIIDDGSTDGTARILDHAQANDPRLRVEHHPPRGIPQAANRGLALCRAPYIARIDADDIAYPCRLARQLHYLQDTNIDCAGSYFDLIDAKGRFLTTLKPPLDNGAIQKATLAGHAAICHPACIYTHRIIDLVGGYDAQFATAEDLDLYLRIGERGRLGNVPQPLLQYRLHAASISERQCVSERACARRACRLAWRRRGIDGRFEADNLWRPGNDRRSRYDFALKYGWWAFLSVQRRTAMIYGCKAIQHQPLRPGGWKLLACAAVKKPIPQPAAS